MCSEVQGSQPGLGAETDHRPPDDVRGAGSEEQHHPVEAGSADGHGSGRGRASHSPRLLARNVDADVQR